MNVLIMKRVVIALALLTLLDLIAIWYFGLSSVQKLCQWL